MTENHGREALTRSLENDAGPSKAPVNNYELGQLWSVPYLVTPE